MRFEIRHLTRYRYSKRVVLDRHRLRVLPRCDARQRLLSHELRIDPEPAHRVNYVDAWGNAAIELGFAGDTAGLEIDVRLTLDTQRPESPSSVSQQRGLLLHYGEEAVALQPYLTPVAEEQAISDFVADLREGGHNNPLMLLDHLNQRIHGFYRHGVRLAGAAQTPAETLRKGAGVCRDLAVLFVAACRHLGIAARFVSGYQETPASSDHDTRYLHAWAEVYLPHAGWLGYDQTHAHAVGEGHVVVASAAAPSGAAPLEGSLRFRGNPPTSSLDTEIRIETY